MMAHSKDMRVLLLLLVGAAVGTTAILAGMAVFLPRGADPTPMPGPTETASPATFTTAPDFELTGRFGQTVTDDELDGKAWIAEFIFTRCAGACPVMMSSMTRVREALSDHPDFDDLRIVSFTVDPEYDTTEVLRTYAEVNGIGDDPRWYFLTGPQQRIRSISQRGFGLGVGEDPDNAAMPIYHSTKFTLIDREGVVHGRYDSFEEAEMDQLITDTAALLGKGGL